MRSIATAKQRAMNLVSQMTIEEKASQLRYDAPAVERLGIPAYNWWNEALHGVARAGTATVFPQAIGLAATFDEALVQKIADVIATEGRAKYNAYSSKGDRDIYKGLTFWSPNINIFRDPRWGRGHETYGEDPYLTARLGAAFVKGLQGDKEVLKAAACAKHFAVHSGPESERHSFDAVVGKKDLFETYLPAFEALVKEAEVEGVMGAYNRVNGEPCCGSQTLLKDILRGAWGFEGYVVSDCWAIRDFHTRHMVTSTAPESAAMALRAGCDLNCGNTYLHILQALKDGLISEQDIDRAVIRLLTTRIRLGMFDEDCEYDSIPYEVVDCREHDDLALEACRRSLVLLKNDGILPLDKNKLSSIAVIGPTADSREILKGNYCGTSSCHTTMLEGIKDYVGDDVRVYYSEGCHLYKDRIENLAQPGDRLSEAVIAAEHAELVILCLGLDANIEGEEGDAGNSRYAGDKMNLELVGQQQELLERIVALQKPTVLLLSTGSAMAVGYADTHCSAVMQTWYMGSHGGRAVAEVLFGAYSPSGKLPVTFYSSTDELPDFTDYSMKNRTYRYYRGKPLYPFGHGLSYTSFAYSDLTESSVTVQNAGRCDGWETVMVYIKILGSRYAVPNKSLCFFKSIFLKQGEQATVHFELAERAFMVVNEEGQYVKDGTGYILSCADLTLTGAF
jgi:beta-glucosidase